MFGASHELEISDEGLHQIRHACHGDLLHTNKMIGRRKFFNSANKAWIRAGDDVMVTFAHDRSITCRVRFIGTVGRFPVCLVQRHVNCSDNSHLSTLFQRSYLNASFEVLNLSEPLVFCKMLFEPDLMSEGFFFCQNYSAIECPDKE